MRSASGAVRGNVVRVAVVDRSSNADEKLTHVSPTSDRSLQTIVLYPPLFENLLAIRYLRERTLRYAHL